jgi:small subunit ribosomal protein S4e
MPRNPKKHLKRLNAPKHWMLGKLGGTFAPKPSAGPHKARECLPLILILRNRLKYALNGREVSFIVKNRNIKIDGKVRTDATYPAGFQDVITIDKTGEFFRLIFNIKGRYITQPITAEEAKFKLGKVRRAQVGQKNIPFVVTHDGRTIRFPDPLIEVHDTVKIDLATGKITDFVKFDTGNLAMITGGRNLGRIGIIERREKHPGSTEIVHLKDAIGHAFATRIGNVFVIGKGNTSLITIPKNKGVRQTILEEKARREKAKRIALKKSKKPRKTSKRLALKKASAAKAAAAAKSSGSKTAGKTASKKPAASKTKATGAKSSTKK